MIGLEKKYIKLACKLHGGIKPVAENLGIDPGNLNKWLNGKRGLPHEKEIQLINELGFADSKPRRDIVHSWKINRVFLNNLKESLRIYFPSKALICRAPWVNTGTSIKDSFHIGDAPQNLYGICDGSVRAILRIPRSLLIQPENIKGWLTWKDGSQEKSKLSISDASDTWKTGVPSIAEFDRAWGGKIPTLIAEEDVIEAILDAGVTFEEAIEAIKSINKKRKKSC
jgi:hypothetical protein